MYMCLCHRRILKLCLLKKKNKRYWLEANILNLFTVDGRILLFKNSSLYSKYFEWYVEGITLEEIKEIYSKYGMEFYDVVWLDEKKQEQARVLKR